MYPDTFGGNSRRNWLSPSTATPPQASARAFRLGTRVELTVNGGIWRILFVASDEILLRYRA